MANGLEKSMDYQAVGQIRAGFLQAADVCKAVRGALTAAISALKMAFILPGAKAAERWLEGIKRAVGELEEELRELAGDLQNSIEEHRQAEQEAAGGFTE